jgi:toxin-antitoxin system PIN domain toxin
MIAVDTSVLAYALNRHAPEHARAVRAVEELAGGERPWALPWCVVHELLRLVTLPHACVRPLRASDAWAFTGQLVASPTVRLLAPTERHAASLVEVLGTLPAGPDGCPGVELAVVLREHGIRELLSLDRGMRRFPFLVVRDPVRGEPWTPASAPLRRYRVLSSRGPRRADRERGEDR